MSNDVRYAINVLSETMVKDKDFTRGWRDNISVRNQDQGLSKDKADKAANDFMKAAFCVNLEE